MASSAFYIALFAAFAMAIGEGLPSKDGAKAIGQYIPKRCVENTRTPVTCTMTHSANATLLPHPDDCELFYYCVSAEQPAICLQCPAHLHFNRHDRVCDYPQNAGCQS